MKISSSLRPPGSLRVMGIFSLGVIITLSLSISSADKDQKMTEEEAESAEVIGWKPFWVFGLPGRVGNRAFSSLARWPLSLWAFLPQRALRPLCLSFLFV